MDIRKSTLNTHWKDWSWSSNSLATWCKELAHWKRPCCCWERLSAGGEEGVRGWDGWITSLLDSRGGREYISVVLIHRHCGVLSSSSPENDLKGWIRHHWTHRRKIYWETILHTSGETYSTCSTRPNHGAWQVRGRSKTRLGWTFHRQHWHLGNLWAWMTAHLFLCWVVQLPPQWAETRVRVRVMTTWTNAGASKLLVSPIPWKTGYNLGIFSQEIRAHFPSKLNRVSEISQIPWSFDHLIHL